MIERVPPAQHYKTAPQFFNQMSAVDIIDVEEKRKE